MKRYLFLFILLFPLLSFSENKSLEIKHVIYITLDGVSWQDVFRTKGVFPKLWSKYGKQGKFYGNPASNIRMEVASVPTSLPSYQSQMAGVVQPCQDNDCGRIKTKTLLENLLNDHQFQRKDVVVFASWHKIADVVEHKAGSLFTNIGNQPLLDPISHHADQGMAKINEEQSKDHPKDGDRFDRYTFAQAFHYFQKFEPRFMWISLTDADNAAHQNDRERYFKALQFYDEAIDQLFTELKQKKLDKNTLVIITTDHGRASGDNWMHHGPKYPTSRKIWAFVMNGKLDEDLIEQNIYYYSTLSIRPAIEKAFNVKS